MNLIADQPVGILGGGQLARMLSEAAFRLGLTPICFTGKLEDETALRGFLGKAPIIAFENEFVDCDALERAARGLGARFAPGLPAIRTLQDKLNQKRLLEKLAIPTARHEPIPSPSQVAAVLAGFPNGCVLKTARLGYDGNGVLISPDPKAAEEFVRRSLERGIPVFAEEKVAFKREVAIVAVRARSGAFAAYPLVISEQDRGICKKVHGPASAFGVPAALEARAAEFARKVAEETQLEGAFALELFLTADQSLLVNEIAPRVHNTGHYSQDAGSASQFENHWRALLSLPLGETRPLACFAMLNLLGPEGVTRTGEVPLPLPGARGHLHWYGKAEIRPRRKLGHLNAAFARAEELPAVMCELEAADRNWQDELRKTK